MKAQEQQSQEISNENQSSFVETESGSKHMIARVNAIAIKAAFPYIAQDDVRYYLCGVNIRPLDDGAVMIVATDGHRFLIVRDPSGYAEKEIIVTVTKDAIKHAEAGVTFDVMSNGEATWNGKVGEPIFIQPGNSLIEGSFPRIETVVNPIGYQEGIAGSVNMSYLSEATKLKLGSKTPAIRFFTKDSDSPLLFTISEIGEIEVIGGIMKRRDPEWLPTWLPTPGEFELAAS